MDTSVCIEQKGTVEEITSHYIRVKTRRDVLCGHCNAQGICYMGDGAERIIEINNFTSDIKLGDTVGITISRGMGNKAIVLGYLVPFLILVGTLLMLSQVGLEEWLTGVLSISALIPYFFMLFLLRNRLRKTFRFSARKKEF
jgi:positive regulator of sigma E activity